MRILVTGSAGFIGSALAERLARDGYEVLGIDNLNAYYDPAYKLSRLQRCGFIFPDCREERVYPVVGDKKELTVELPPYGNKYYSEKYRNLSFVRSDISKFEALEMVFAWFKPEIVINMAAQAGVRYSFINPDAYIETNITGFVNLLECIKRYDVRRMVYASSSSVYWGSKKLPYSEADGIEPPLSLYAATKRCDELFAEVYRRQFNIEIVGLRFFTVYGPWGRPDMAPMIFAEAISKGEPLKIFNGGDMYRDFTYIDDIVEATCRVINSENPRCNMYNIGSGRPERVEDFVGLMEKNMGKTTRHELCGMQSGDVKKTYSDQSRYRKEFDYSPDTEIKKGVESFIKWYKGYIAKK